MNYDKVIQDQEFLTKLKYEARGVTNGDNLFNLFLKYFNETEKYVSDLEIENFRLELRNRTLEDASINIANSTYSLLLMNTRKLTTVIKKYNKK